MTKLTFGHALKTSMFLGLALSLSCKVVAMNTAVTYEHDEISLENARNEFVVSFINELISHSKQFGSLCIKASQEELTLYPRGSAESDHVNAIIQAGILNFQALLLSLKDNRISFSLQREIEEKLITVKKMYLDRMHDKIEDALESIRNLNHELTDTLCKLKESYFSKIKQLSFIERWEWELNQQT